MVFESRRLAMLIYIASDLCYGGLGLACDKHNWHHCRASWISPLTYLCSNHFKGFNFPKAWLTRWYTYPSLLLMLPYLLGMPDDSIYSPLSHREMTRWVCVYAYRPYITLRYVTLHYHYHYITGIQTYRHTDRHTDIHTYRHTDIQTDVHTVQCKYVAYT